MALESRYNRGAFQEETSSGDGLGRGVERVRLEAGSPDRKHWQDSRRKMRGARARREVKKERDPTRDQLDSSVGALSTLSHAACV